jgi:hypothetical protein
MAKMRGMDSKSPVKEQPNQFSRAFMLQQERNALTNRVREIDAEIMRMAKPNAH